jgi:hypothetical protein
MGAGLDLLPGTDETVFIRAAQDAGTVLKSMSGFVGRRLAKAEDGTWFDLVEWSDATNATKAAEIFHTIPGAQPYLLPGIGPAPARWLMEVDVSTEADLRSLGAVAVYCRLKHSNPKRVGLNARWGLYSALTGVPWNQIDTETKARLLAEVGEGRH